MKKFVIHIFLISVILGLVSWLVFSKVIPQFYLPAFPFLILFFAGFTILIHYYQLKMAKKNMAKFTRSNMLVTFIKLFLYSVVAIVFIATDRNNAKVFVVYFVLLYVVFTIYEVFSLLKLNSCKNRNG